MTTKILFITYDGLTDPLGQSQILPYMCGLSDLGYQITILSCEKVERFALFANDIQKIVKNKNIKWEYISFTAKPPILAKLYDYRCLLSKARQIVKREQINIVHCRSYVAADIGLKLKYEFACKMVFDMRGFWADERKDSGAWDTNKLLYRYLYKNYKQKERSFLLNADYVITLTNAAKHEILAWDYIDINSIKIATIPCCADMSHFTLTSPEEKNKARAILNINQTAFVLSYLGSIGAWYMLDEMLSLFNVLLVKYPNAKFLFITHSDPKLIYAKLNEYGISVANIIIKSASRDEVPLFLKASDINVSFIRRVYSKIASSPTKNAEVLATGIPIILNAGIGDVDEIVNSGVGFCVTDFNTIEYEKVVENIAKIIEISPNKIRSVVSTNYDLEYAINIYNQVYLEVVN